jgi:hypothetical protein
MLLDLEHVAAKNYKQFTSRMDSLRLIQEDYNNFSSFLQNAISISFRILINYFNPLNLLPMLNLKNIG